MLTGKKIKQEWESKRIHIEPFNPKQCQPHSYDLRLGDKLVQVVANCGDRIDTSLKSKVIPIEQLNEGGFMIFPGQLYLGHTVEVVGSNHYAPLLHSRSSTARQGAMMHFAGFCDVGWIGQITLEIVNMTASPIVLYPGHRVCQLQFDTLDGEIELYDSDYQYQSGPTPAKGLGD